MLIQLGEQLNSVESSIQVRPTEAGELDTEDCLDAWISQTSWVAFKLKLLQTAANMGDHQPRLGGEPLEGAWYS